MKKLARELEEVVVDAWPATESEELDGWLLRKSGGPSRRGNSVATNETGGKLSLDERVAHTESWYAARGQPAMFQVGPCAPVELDHVLQERGYAQSADAVLAGVEPSEVLTRLSSADAQVSRTPCLGWWQMVREASRFSESVDVLAALLDRLGTRCRFATRFDGEGRAIATCFGIASERRLGIYGMLTLPEARRSGAAASLLRALSHAAREEQMEELYLLVEADNEPARALYARAGFRDVYRYHYRVRT